MSLVACPVAQDPSHAWSEACAERRNSMKIELSVSVPMSIESVWSVAVDRPQIIFRLCRSASQ